MGWEAVFTGVVVSGVLVGMAINLPADALIIGAAILCGVAGILSTEEVFSGFANEGMLTVAALFVVTAGLRETGALEILGRMLLGKAKTESAVLRRMFVCVTAISAFLNNTPVVAMFMPILMNWSQKNRVSASRLLLPLSFFSVLGGCCTLIGTSTNLVVQGMLEEWHERDPERYANLVPLGFWEIGYAGIPFAIVGGIYILTVGRRLLPDRKDFFEKMGETAREYLVNMQILPGCPLVGKSVAEAGLRHLEGLFLIEIVRGEESIAPVRPDRVMHAGDILTFTGVVNHIVDLERIKGLVPVAEEGEERKLLDRKAGTLCEAVISNTSPLVGKSIRETNFRALYNAAVIAVHRGGARMKGRIGDIDLKQGDTLLLQAGPHFTQAHRNNPDFFLVSGIEDSRPVRHEKAMIAIALTGVLVALLAADVISTAVAAFLIAGMMILMRCLSMAEARQSLDLQTLLTIAAAFGLGKAMVNSGLVGMVSEVVVANAGILGPLGVLAGVYLLSSAVTELVTNNAAAALMFPFAVEVAEQLDVSARPFIIAVALAASASFMTPIGYQTNLMVYGPGGYKFTDFLRIGTPLNAILFGVAMIIIPLAWPF